MTKIFITGGAGFIGSHTVDLCVREGYDVTVFDVKPWEQAVNLHHLEKGSLTYVEGNIRNPDVLKVAMQGHTHVLHLAALVSVPESIKDPFRFHDVNVTGTMNVFEIAQKLAVSRVVYASSAAVYGTEVPTPTSETSVTRPQSPYGTHKLVNETYATLYRQLFSQSNIGLRYFNVYGSRQDPLSPYSGVISIFSKKIREGESVHIYGDGSAVRDFVSVSDVAQANILALFSTAQGVCNIATGIPSTVNQLVDTLENLLERKAFRMYEDKREGDIEYSCADTTQAKKLIDFVAQDTLKTGLEKMIS